MRAFLSRFLVVLAFLVPSAAWACTVGGTLVCADTHDPVSGAALTFTIHTWDGQTLSYPSTLTDGTGAFSIYVDGQWCGDSFSVTVDPNGAEPPGATTLPGEVQIVYQTPLAPIVVDASVVPACTPRTPSCPELLGLTEATFCLDRPLGTAAAECAYFGLAAIGRDDFQSATATMAADLAIVKGGLCYATYLGVTPGTPFQGPNGKGISHVTYCACPPQ